MIPEATFDRMLALTRNHGLSGARMPNFGYLTGASKEQIQRLNMAYSDARNKHQGARR